MQPNTVEAITSFVPSESQPILSIIRHFDLPILPAYKWAHGILLEAVEDPEQFEWKEGDLQKDIDLAAIVFGNYPGNASLISAMMRYHIYKHRRMVHELE
jgi:hypothetical protein